jgi:hypothetical protein
MRSRRTESGDGRAKVTQHGRLGIAHLALDRDLRFHVDTAEPRAEYGDGDSGHGKYWREVYYSEEFEEHGG